MKRLLKSVVLVACAGTMLFCSLSEAQARRYRPEKSREQGFMFKFGFPMVAGCTDFLCHEIDPIISFRTGVYFRFMHYLAVGFHLTPMFGLPKKDNVHPLVYDPERTVQYDIFWNFVIGPEFRYIFPLKQWDFWAGVLLGFARWGAVGEQVEPTPEPDWEGWMNGFVIGWGLGADYYITKNFAIGADFYIYVPAFDHACTDDGTTRICGDMTKMQRYDVGFWWSIGLLATFFLPV